MRVEGLDVEASVEARKSGDAPKMKVSDRRPLASGESMRVEHQFAYWIIHSGMGWIER